MGPAQSCIQTAVNRRVLALLNPVDRDDKGEADGKEKLQFPARHPRIARPVGSWGEGAITFAARSTPTT